VSISSGHLSLNDAESETLDRDMAKLKELVEAMDGHVGPQLVNDVDWLFKVSPRCVFVTG
jgi:hypothetical protein